MHKVTCFLKSDLNKNLELWNVLCIVHMSFLLEDFLLYRTNKVFLAFIKILLILRLRHWKTVDWLIFDREQIWRVHLNLTLPQAEILLTACNHFCSVIPWSHCSEMLRMLKTLYSKMQIAAQFANNLTTKNGKFGHYLINPYKTEVVFIINFERVVQRLIQKCHVKHLK